MSELYYRDVVDELRKALTDDPREPGEWSDGDKLRLLAALFDEQDLKRGSTDHDVQDDLRRMAERLDSLRPFCAYCQNPIDDHPITNLYMGGVMGYVHGEQPQRCDGIEPFFYSTRISTPTPGAE